MLCDMIYYRYEILSKRETEASLLLFVQDPMTKQPMVMKLLRPYQDLRYPSRADLHDRQVCQLKALQWNRKFTPEAYIGLAGLHKEYKENDHQICIGDIIKEPSEEDMKAGVEYALLMRQLPEDRCLETLLNEEGKTRHARIKLLTRYVAQLHMDVDLLAVPPVSKGNKVRWGSLAQLQDKLRHNTELFNLMLEDNPDRYLAYTSNPDTLARVFAHNLYGEYFEQRLQEQRIRHCHGDLKVSNIWLMPTDNEEFNERVLLLDAIDFNPIYSNIDILSDFAMLVVDVQARLLIVDEQKGTNSSDLAHLMIDDYLQLTGQVNERDRSVLLYYLVEKAIVCAAISTMYDKSPDPSSKYLEVAAIYKNQLERRLDR